MGEERDGTDRFPGTVTEQAVLEVFDYADDPVLSTREVAEGLQRFGEGRVTREAARNRLEEIHEAGLVERDALGARAVRWRATVAPELDAATADRVDARRGSEEWDRL